MKWRGDRVADRVGDPGTPPARLGIAERAARIVFLGGVLYAALAQGAFYRHQAVVFWPVVIAAALIAVTAMRVHRRGWPGSTVVWLAPALGSTVVSAWAAGDIGGAIPTLMTIAAVSAALVVSGSAMEGGGARLLDGLVATGCVVAFTAAHGVVHRHEPWGRLVIDLWRGSSSLTYSNAAAALIVPLLLVMVARLVRAPGQPIAIVVAHVLVVGAASTSSRGGVLAGAVGLSVLVLAVGLAKVVAALTPVALGAIVSIASVLSMAPVGVDRSPLWSWLGVAIGVTVSLATRTLQVRILRPRSVVLAGAVVALLAVIAVVLANDSGSLSGRVTLRDQNRADEWSAAWDEFTAHPIIGVGPGQARYAFEQDGEFFVAEFAHQEYLEVAAEQGLLGLIAVVLPIGAVIVVLVRRLRIERDALTAGTLAAFAAFVSHSAFDFLWHIPVLPVVIAAVVGVELRRRPEPPTLQ